VQPPIAEESPETVENDEPEKVKALTEEELERVLAELPFESADFLRFLGHLDPGFTLRTYVHLLPEDLPEPNFGVKVGNKWATQATEISRNGDMSADVESADLQAEVSVALGASGA